MSRFKYEPKDVKWYKEMTRRIDDARREMAFTFGDAVFEMAERRATNKNHRIMIQAARAIMGLAKALGRSQISVLDFGQEIAKVKQRAGHRENPKAEPAFNPGGTMNHKGDCEHYFANAGPAVYRGGVSLKGIEPIRGTWDGRPIPAVIARGESAYEGKPDVEVMNDGTERKVYKIIERHYGIPCPDCDGRGRVSGCCLPEPFPCDTCNGTGQHKTTVNHTAEGLREALLEIKNRDGTRYTFTCKSCEHVLPPRYRSDTDPDLCYMCEPLDTVLVRLAKENYKSVSGQVKPGINRDGSFFAPLHDLCESETTNYFMECSMFECKYSDEGEQYMVRSVYPPHGKKCHRCGSPLELITPPK